MTVVEENIILVMDLHVIASENHFKKTLFSAVIESLGVLLDCDMYLPPSWSEY